MNNRKYLFLYKLFSYLKQKTDKKSRKLYSFKRTHILLFNVACVKRYYTGKLYVKICNCNQKNKNNLD